MRELSYHCETSGNTTENRRNANPLDYIKACEVITNAETTLNQGKRRRTPTRAKVATLRTNLRVPEQKLRTLR